ncbi:arginase family protein [Aminipila sp.]|uniref:arginase family protein n=1 Tax=Aminipila sp. TaxID=2060095 RepID=UPI0028A01B11|nr:arginase family protein [Aminipila sp.]
MKHMNLFFPQWQGAGKTKELLKGARDIKEKYMDTEKFFEVLVDEEENNQVENDILGYHTLLQQLKAANSIINKEIPDCIFTVGGGCDVEIIPVSYLNHKLSGDLTVLWFDAHGDLNTPESSPSKNFHGMPLRTLLGDGNRQMIQTAFSQLKPAQLLMVGQRDLDEPEERYVKEKKVSMLDAEEFALNPNGVIEEIGLKGSKNLYVHIDLDVLDFEEFPYVMVPSPGGIKSTLLLDLLRNLTEHFNVVGLSLLEYTGSEEKKIKILSDIIEIGLKI